MLVMCVIAGICVLGIVGGLASTLSYDELYGQETRPPPPPVRRRKARRRSRQLQAVEAALAIAEGHPPAADPTERT